MPDGELSVEDGGLDWMPPILTRPDDGESDGRNGGLLRDGRCDGEFIGENGRGDDGADGMKPAVTCPRGTGTLIGEGGTD